MAISRHNLSQRLLLSKVVFGCVICAILAVSKVRGQSPPTTAALLPSFEVASIKPNHSGGGMIRVEAPKGGFRGTNMTAKALIGWAYAGISIPRRDDQILGGPGWTNSDRYDIDAKLEDSEVEAMEKLPSDQRIEQIRLRVKSLLADRFKLAVREETKEVPVYALVVGKGGPKLKEAKPGDTYPNGLKGPDGRPMSMFMGIDQLTGQALPMSTLVMALSHQVGRMVLDQTGLKGKYDIALKWTPDQSQPTMLQGPSGTGAETTPPPASSGPSIFTALQEQLGLKLESQKGPEEVLVIDHIERPSEN